MISDKHQDVLQEIIELKGSCLDAPRCLACPFKKECLPEFVKGEGGAKLSKPQRMNKAVDLLTNLELIGEIYDGPSK